MVKEIKPTEPAEKPTIDSFTQLLFSQYEDALNQTVARKEQVQKEAASLSQALKQLEEEFQKLSQQELLAKQSLQTIKTIQDHATELAAPNVEAAANAAETEAQVEAETQIAEEVDYSGLPDDEYGALDHDAAAPAKKVKSKK